MGLRLNLGSGQQPLEGHINVDKHGAPDMLVDLEVRPWPWENSSVDEVAMHHVLEHLGRTPELFIGVMKELHRICRPGALVRIRVPHPRHDFFLTDPTHVRPILPGTLAHFSKRENLAWAEIGAANTPLALYHGVDFEIQEHELLLDEPYRSQLKSGSITQQEAQAFVDKYNNVASEIRITLRVVK